MINISERYTGRKLKEDYYDFVMESSTELDETFLLQEHISPTITALIYFEKDSKKIRVVRCKKETARKWSLVTDLSDAYARKLDNRIGLFFEEETE